MKLRLVLAFASVIALAGFLAFQFLAPKLDETAADVLGRGDYRLEATDGTAFTEATLVGSPSAVFFGFTHCPDVCPTTLGDIAMWREDLGEQADDVRFYFVSVDPERDTLDILGDYVGWVDGVLGVTGSRVETDKAIRAFRVFASKVPLEGGGYNVDHSAFVLLFDRQGRFVEPIRYQEEFERAVGKLKRLLAS